MSALEKAEKWDKVTKYLEISGGFLECDESIVLDILKKGTENHDKLEAIKKTVEDMMNKEVEDEVTLHYYKRKILKILGGLCGEKEPKR